MNLNFIALNIITILLVIQISDQRTYLVPEEQVPDFDPRYETKLIRTRVDQHFGTMYLKLAIFYDNYLLIRFGGNFKEMERFVSSVVYSSQLYYNRDNILSFAYFKFVVTHFSEYPGLLNNTYNKFNTFEPSDVGNNEILQGDFCNYATSHLNPQNQTIKWNAALLLTGLNLFGTLKPGQKKELGQGLDKELGMAYQDKICKDSPCGIIETRDVFVTHIFSHELGHILSLEHDGDVGCDPHRLIMTASFSKKSVSDWSHCSADKLRNKLKTLQLENKLDECMKEKVEPLPPFNFNNQDLPGIEWPIEEQCQFTLGPQYEAITTPPYYDICSSLHCRNKNKWFERLRGFPAMEGSYCGSKQNNGKEVRHYCRSDVCTTKLTPKPNERSIQLKDMNKISNKMLASNLNIL